VTQSVIHSPIKVFLTTLSEDPTFTKRTMSNQRKHDDIANLVVQYTEKGPRCSGEIWKFLTKKKGLQAEAADEAITQLARWSPEKLTCRRMCRKQLKQEETDDESESEIEELEQKQKKKVVFASEQDFVYSYAGIFYDSTQAKEVKQKPHVFEELFTGKIGIIVVMDPLSMEWGKSDEDRAFWIQNWLTECIVDNTYKWRLTLNSKNGTRGSFKNGKTGTRRPH
jgi:hypothetical protein